MKCSLFLFFILIIYHEILWDYCIFFLICLYSNTTWPFLGLFCYYLFLVKTQSSVTDLFVYHKGNAECFLVWKFTRLLLSITHFVGQPNVNAKKYYWIFIIWILVIYRLILRAHNCKTWNLLGLYETTGRVVPRANFISFDWYECLKNCL